MTADPILSSRIGRRAALGALAGGLAAGRAGAQEAVRVPHAFGEAVIPRPPRRVVSLGRTTHDTLLALGVEPVAVRYWFGDQPDAIWPWARPFLKGRPPEVLTGEVSVERVAILEPDLIVGIGSGIPRATYDALSKVAPVVMEAAGGGAFTPWDAMLATLGQALGRQEAAAALAEGLRRRFAETRARHPGWAGRTAVAAYHVGGETGLYTPQDARGNFLRELGFAEPAAAARTRGRAGFYASLSPEDLSPIDADLLLWVSSSLTAAELAAIPMRRFLRAHREGREVVASPLVAAALSFGSVLSLPVALDALEGEIAAAVDGDPATGVPSTSRAGLAP